MSTNSIFHSEIPIHCCNIIKQFESGKSYFKEANKYFIPFYCQNVNQKNRILSGNFVYPMWNPLKKAILYNSNAFKYSFIKINDVMLQTKHSDFEVYHIYSNIKMYPASIKLSKHNIYTDSYLLFSIDSDIMEPLIKKNLI
jgi:hypothetical protein